MMGHLLQETQCSGSGITYPDTASREISGAYSDQRQSVLKLIRAKNRLKSKFHKQLLIVFRRCFQTLATQSKGSGFFQSMRILITAIL